jgi:hypothetical protein
LKSGRRGRVEAGLPLLLLRESFLFLVQRRIALFREST